MVLDFVSSTWLSFVPCALRATRVVPTPDRVTIEAVPRTTLGECPVCCTASRRIHSWYRRVLHDLPWQGRPVTIHVVVRRFHCLNGRCARRTFAERLTNVTCLFGRRTGRLRKLQHHLGLALGGEAEARLAARISAPTSPDTLLRLASGNSEASSLQAARVVSSGRTKRGQSGLAVLTCCATSVDTAGMRWLGSPPSGWSSTWGSGGRDNAEPTAG